MTIGCNSCYTLWYEDREGICQPCETGGSNAMMAAAVLLPFIAGFMYYKFNKEQDEDEEVVAKKRGNEAQT